MLTKDLLKVTVRGEKIFPRYLDVSSAEVREIATSLLKEFSQAPGLQMATFLANNQELLGNLPDYAKGLAKIIERNLEFEDPEDAGQLRHEVLAESEVYRSSSSGDLQGLRDHLSRRYGVSWSELQAKIYGDLPEFRKILNFAAPQLTELLYEYNIGLVQGLLANTSRINVSCRDLGIKERRLLFRMIRFHKLQVEITQEGKTIDLDIAGPDALSVGVSSYAIHLGAFFRSLLKVPDWSLSAEAVVKNKHARLAVCAGGHFPKESASGGYIPEEFEKFREAFNQKDMGWLLEQSAEVVKGGAGKFWLPDWVLKSQKSQVHVELFHRWHKGVLAARLRDLGSIKRPDYMLGVEKSLLKNKDIGEAFKVAQEKGVLLFAFNGLPSVKAVLAQLA